MSTAPTQTDEIAPWPGIEAEQPIPGLHSSAPQPLSFAPTTTVRAFLLARERGNLLIYSADSLESEAEGIASLGGVSRRYLNHRHEAMFPAAEIEAPLFVHEADRASVARALEVRGAFSKRHHLDEDFEVIPTPGHTPGATAYLWDSGDHRVLFTGDTLYLDEGRWVAAVLGSSDRDRYIESLELIRGLEFDVLAPWAATRGHPYLAHTDAADARDRIDAILERLRRGEDA